MGYFSLISKLVEIDFNLWLERERRERANNFWVVQKRKGRWKNGMKKKLG